MRRTFVDDTIQRPAPIIVHFGWSLRKAFAEFVWIKAPGLTKRAPVFNGWTIWFTKWSDEHIAIPWVRALFTIQQICDRREIMFRLKSMWFRSNRLNPNANPKQTSFVRNAKLHFKMKLQILTHVLAICFLITFISRLQIQHWDPEHTSMIRLGSCTRTSAAQFVSFSGNIWRFSICNPSRQ